MNSQLWQRKIFLFNLFLSLYISDLSCFFFLEKSYPPLFQQAPLKVEVLSSPPPIWKFDRRFNSPPPAERGVGVGAYYDVGLLVLHLLPPLSSLANCRSAASLTLFYMYHFGRRSFELAQSVPLPYSWGRSTRYSNRLHDFVNVIPRCQQFLSLQS